MVTQKEIRRILQGKNLAFEKIIRTSDRFYLVLAKDRKKEVVFKILRNRKRKFAKLALKKEADALKFFNSFKSPYLKSPKFFGAELEGKTPYYKEEFIEGRTLERNGGFFFRKLTRKEVDKISEILSGLNKIEISLIKKEISNLSDFGAAYFDFALKHHKREIKRFLGKGGGKTISDLIKKAKKILNNGRKFAVHGEVYPNNLMNNKKGDIILIDWENIGIGNPAHDVASVYLRLKNKVLSERLMRNLTFSKEDFFKLFFKIEIILQSLGSLSYFEDSKIPEKLKKEAKGYFLCILKNFLNQ